ncbi:MAG: DUF92 domain-containing protein [Candidatus Omnitrophica bacterium]|nr:DUF92 domain-containing protein [Candidatus Omnitrophota bacterium]
MDSLLVRFIVGFILNLAIGTYAFTQQMIDDAAFLGGVVLFTLVFVCLNWQAYIIIIAFFVINGFVLEQESKYKSQRGEFALFKAKRPLKRVLGRSLPGAVFAVLFFLTGRDDFRIAFVASYAAAVFDAVSTKMGQIFSRVAVTITGLKKVKHGTPGAVSLQGTLAGLAAALIVSIVAIPVRFINFYELGIIVFAALISGFIDSFLSAYSHQNRRIPNEFINFFSSMSAGLICIFAVWFLGLAY